MKNIYKHSLPVKTLLYLELISGITIITLFIYLIKNEIYPGIWVFAGPLLGIALVISGISSLKIKEINIYESQKFIQIERESLFTSKETKIKFSNLKSEIKTTNGKKKSLIKKLKVIILDSDKEVVELTSIFLGLNNEKIKKIHFNIKNISKNY